MKALREEFTETTVGIGLVDFALDADPRTREARVVTALVDSPAYRAGIQPRDTIVSLNGTPTRGLDHEQVMDLLRTSSEAGETVVLRRGGRTLTVTLKPSSEKVEAVRPSTKAVKHGTIGYIQIIKFTPDAGQYIRDAVQKFEQDGVDRFIVDVRNNPGGMLNAAARGASAFATGTLGWKVRRDGRREPITSEAVEITKKALAILINEGTASAAEFLAGALQDRHRALLIGLESYGRGQAQAYVPLADGYGLLGPSAELHTPSDRTFTAKGIQPNIAVSGGSSTPENIAIGRDSQFLRAGIGILP